MASVSRTSKFFVLDLMNSQIVTVADNNGVAKINKPKEVIHLGAGKRISIDDVRNVAYLKHEIEVDPSFYEKLATDASKKKSVSLILSSPIESGNSSRDVANVSYPLPLCRAALFFKFSTFLQGRSGLRAEVIQIIQSMLNADVIPNFTSENTAGCQLANIISGFGDICFSGGVISNTASAFNLHEIEIVKLTVEEANILKNEKFLMNGAACLLTSVTANIISTADCIAALSCEAFGAYTDAFDAAHFELNRQHRGQIASASNLRLLLEGSKLVNNTKTKKDLSSILAFQKIPQIHGSVQENLSIISKALDIELNSAPSGPVDSDQSMRFEPVPSAIALDALYTLLNLLYTSSQERLEGLLTLSINRCNNNKAQTTLPGPGVASATAEEKLLATYYLTNRLNTQLCSELQQSMQSMKELDATASSAVTSVDVTKEAKASTNSKPEQDESNLTPEQRAKAEAKRKAKAEKAAAKAAVKDSKKAGSSTLGTGGAGALLGVGTAKFRNFVMVKIVGDDGDVVIGELLTAYCKGLLEELSTAGGNKRKPKIAKGARDYTPDQMRVREQAFAAIRRVFKRHGGVEIDTPVFELKEVLTGKYGEDSKLIYDLADQGGELLCLRYDLTVPFARFLAMNTVGNIKRYHIAKVYRRDQPQLNRGRYREFYQCDFDIAGSYTSMVPDAEVISVAVEILTELPVGPFLIKLNHRKLLDAIFELCGVPSESFRPICSAVDKLDKLSWEEVREEMVGEKGLEGSCADLIGRFVCKKGSPKVLWAELMQEGVFGAHEGARQAMGELEVLFGYLEAMGTLGSVSFDMSLARGLDYYTGVIYEAVLTDGTSQVGSIAAGGRYDSLVGMFSASGVQTPCVGVSIGIERVFTIMEKKAEDLKLMQTTNIQVFIASIGDNMMAERMKVAKLLWQANIACEYSHLENPKFKKQLDDVLERGISYMLVFGPDELLSGTVKLKDIARREEVVLSLEEAVNALLERGCRPIAPGADLQLLDAMRAAVTAVGAGVPLTVLA